MNWTTLLFSIIASLLTLVTMYIDSRLFDRPRPNSIYIKNMIWVGIVTYAVREWLPGTISMVEQSGSIEYIHDLGEEMYNGKANF